MRYKNTLTYLLASFGAITVKTSDFEIIYTFNNNCIDSI